MLKYIKRQTSRRRSSAEYDDAGVSDSALDSLRSTTSFCDEIFLEELAQAEEQEPEFNKCHSGSDVGSMSSCLLGADEDIFKYQSRLSMSLLAIVSEPNCLCYFVQYLETKQALPLIKFYLDIENFKRAALTQLDNLQCDELDSEVLTSKHQEHNYGASIQPETIHNANANVNDDVDNDEDNDDVPELKTLCDISMRKPLTDDEKSQIYAETNKQINTKTALGNVSSRLKASSEQSLCSAVSSLEWGCNRVISAASIKDAMVIYQKYLIVNSPLYVALPIAILAPISLLLCKQHHEHFETETDAYEVSCSKPIPAGCFDEARDFVLQKLEREYLQDYLQSSYYCKYCVELIDTQINIYDVLYSEVTLFYFMEYLEQRNERVCLDFWSAAINFRKSYATQRLTEYMANDSDADAQTDAMIIYERFFSLQAGDNRLWMSDKMRCRVEQRICEPGQVAYAFDLPLLVTAKYLEQKYFAEFLKSQLFENYLKELKLKIQTAPVSAPKTNATMAAVTSKNGKETPYRTENKSNYTLQQRRTNMTTKSHISHSNTLLAAMDTGTKPPASSMQIDANQLTNPHLLWQRPHSANGSGNAAGTAGGGLKFGRVNSLGRYERDFETVDVGASKPSWSLSVSGNKIKNAMRKLVNLPEEKMQEEIAWQVAEMIVKDVTNITLGNNNSKNHNNKMATM